MQLLMGSITLADSKPYFCGFFYDIFAATVKEMARQPKEVLSPCTTTALLRTTHSCVLFALKHVIQ